MEKNKREKAGLLKRTRSASPTKDKALLEKEAPTKKVSPFQLYRYTDNFDKFLLFLGIFVSCGTGLGMPMMAVIMGRISQNFIDLGMKVMNPNITDIFVLLQAKDEFLESVIRNCWLYVYLGTAVFISGFLQVTTFVTVCENLTNRLRRTFFNAAMRQEIGWYDKNTSGTLSTKLFDNLERVKEGTGDKIGLGFQFLAQFFGGFAIAIFYDWKLTLVMASLSPLVAICGLFMSRLLATAATKEAKKYAVAGGIAEEVLTSIRTVIAFNGQEQECQRYEAALEEGKKVGVRKSMFIGLGLGTFFIVMFSSYALAFYVGTNEIYYGRLDSATVLTVFFSVMMGSMGLGQAGQQFATMGTACGAAASLYEVIDRTPEIDAYSTEGLKPATVVGRIQTKNVHFTYPTRENVKILNSISMLVEPGQTVALVGSSGSGKSTIIQLLQRFYNPDQGEIYIDDIPISDFNIKYLRQIIGVVSQEPNLFNTTIEQNIRYGRENITLEDIKTALKEANALDFVNSFPKGLNTLVGDRGVQMSGGQKQRIAIARALVKNPKILLLDEATSALDAESEHIVQTALDNASKGRTTIVVAHRLSTIRNADKIIAMKSGEIMEVGTHDELMEKKGLYHELVQSQVFADVEEEEDSEDSDDAVVVTDRKMERQNTVNLNRQQSEKPADAKPDPEKDLDRLKQELKEEGAIRASLFKILKYAKPEWVHLSVATIVSTLIGLVSPAFAFFFSEIIKVFANPDREEMREDGHFWALMFIVLAVVQAAGILAQCFFYGFSAEQLTMRVRSMTFRNVLRQDATYFDMTKHSPGRITTRLATDAPMVKAAIDYRLGSVFNSAVAILAGLAMAFYYGWQLALFISLIFPFVGLAHGVVIKFHSGRAAEDAEQLENSGKIATEAIENIRTVQSLTLQNKMHEEFCGHLDKSHRISRSKTLFRAFLYGAASSIVFFVYAIAFRFGVYLMFNPDVQMHPMAVIRVLFAISFTFNTIGHAATYLPEYIKATFAAGLIFNMLNDEPKIDGMSSRGDKPEITGEVNLNKVYFRYPERSEIPILQGLDVSVKKGETLALVGPSGCGKSTVISLLERLYDPLDGEVQIDGHDLRKMNPSWIRKHIALVSQEPVLFDTSIRKNIAYGMKDDEYTDFTIEEAAKNANIHDFIKDLPDGYDTRVGEKGTQLSGGQKQRIAIARALIRNPKILLLDEATSALDTENEKQVQEALDVAAKDRTCIVVAHRLSTIVNAGCIMVVKHGKVVEKGTHNELMAKRGAYYTLVQKQSMNQK